MNVGHLQTISISSKIEGSKPINGLIPENHEHT